jgi:hypothetical protein
MTMACTGHCASGGMTWAILCMAQHPGRSGHSYHVRFHTTAFHLRIVLVTSSNLVSFSCTQASDPLGRVKASLNGERWPHNQTGYNPLTSPNSHLTATTQTSHPLAPMDSFALFSSVITPESEPATGPSTPIDAILDGGTGGSGCIVA